MAEQGVEIENPVLGKLKVFGMDPNMLFTVLTFATLLIGATLMWGHIKDADAKDAAVIKSNQEVATALKESNREIASVLKETQRETTNILREMARATREQNCLLSQPQERRAAMAETCRRIAQ